MSVLVERVARHEGFKAKPYIDPLVKKSMADEEIEATEELLNHLKLTFGYGFMSLTEKEAKTILRMRLETIESELAKEIDDFYLHPNDVQDVLIEMSFQLGVTGLLSFKKTIQCLIDRDYFAMSIEMLDSKWAKEDSPSRAKELSLIVRGAN